MEAIAGAGGDKLGRAAPSVGILREVTMIYRDFQGKKLSALGFGTMRLPTLADDYGKIDEKAAAEMFDCAISRGVNYFDTAWGYHNGESERAVGKILSKYPRESFYLASKFPGYDVSNFGKTEEIFEKQLQKCGVEYFDFYLFHNVCELNIDAYLNEEKYGTYAYLMEQKRNGRIRHLGFSAHGSYSVVERFLERFGKDMEFCQRTSKSSRRSARTIPSHRGRSASFWISPTSRSFCRACRTWSRSRTISKRSKRKSR